MKTYSVQMSFFTQNWDRKTNPISGIEEIMFIGNAMAISAMRTMETFRHSASDPEIAPWWDLSVKPSPQGNHQTITIPPLEEQKNSTWCVESSNYCDWPTLGTLFKTQCQSKCLWMFYGCQNQNGKSSGWWNYLVAALKSDVLVEV